MKNYIFSRPNNGATFGITTPAGKNFVYHVNHAKKIGSWFIHQIRSRDKRYIGRIDPRTLEITLTNKSSYDEGDEPFMLVRDVLMSLNDDIPLPEGYSIYEK